MHMHVVVLRLLILSTLGANFMFVTQQNCPGLLDLVLGDWRCCTQTQDAWKCVERSNGRR